MPAAGEHWDIVVYADGACLGNPGPGGWGAVLIPREGAPVEKSGGCPYTTNNRMELTAAIESLRATPRGARVLLRSDSRLLVETINAGWKRNRNKDLWDALDQERIKRNVVFEWVKGHHLDPHNARADELAVNAAKLAMEHSAAKTGAPHLSVTRVNAAPRVLAVSRAPGDSLQPPAAGARDAEVESAGEMRSILREGETIARCAQCGREFVRRVSEPAETVCSLAACQFAARQRS